MFSYKTRFITNISFAAAWKTLGEYVGRSEENGVRSG